MPQFARIFERAGAELPLATRLLIGTSNFFVAYWMLLLATIVGSSVALAVAYATADRARRQEHGVAERERRHGSIRAAQQADP